MAATYASLRNSYATYNAMDTAGLYDSIGWKDVVGRPGWGNTCAVRMHLALLDAGEHIAGRFPVLAGKHKGQMLEVSQVRLADKLDLKLGKAVKMNQKDFRSDGYKSIAGKTGIISFQNMSDYAGGHIDVIDTRTWNCLRTCYLDAGQIWFWQVG